MHTKTVIVGSSIGLHARPAAVISEAAVKADLASIAQFNLDIEYCHIPAPVTGRVGATSQPSELPAWPTPAAIDNLLP